MDMPLWFRLLGAFCFVFCTVPVVVRWLREPILSPWLSCPWPGFWRASIAYMEGTPRWRFYLRLPGAAARFYYLTWVDCKPAAKKEGR